MNDYILVTSGFILPDNKWFSPLNSDMGYKDSLLKKEGTLELFVKMDGMIEKGAISSSPEATEVFLEYSNNPSFDNFMLLVDIFTDVFKNTGVLNIVKIQVNNPHLTPTGFQLCLDMLNPYQLAEDHRSYAAVPTFFTMAQKADNKELSTRETRLDKYLKDLYIPSNVDLIKSLVEQREVFASLFKFIFVDFNRGSSHV